MSTRDSVSAPSLMVFDTNLCIARRYPGRTEDRRGGYEVRALKKKKEKNYHNFRETPALTGVPFPALPDYCPPWDSPAVYPKLPNFPEQAMICTRCWLQGTCVQPDSM